MKRNVTDGLFTKPSNLVYYRDRMSGKVTNIIRKVPPPAVDSAISRPY